MMKKFIELVKREEGIDLTKRGLLIEVDDEEEAEKLLTACKKAGFHWCDKSDINPHEDANDEDIFFFEDSIPVIINPDVLNLWADSRRDMDSDERCEYCEFGLRKFLSYLEKSKESVTLPLALLNTSILTTAGEYKLSDISLEDVKKLVADAEELDSAIGHQSTAEIMTTLLETEVAVNRQMFAQEVGQQALVFKLNGRPEEGKILTKEEIEKIGYKFQLLERTN